jgi:hypothetical protein
VEKTLKEIKELKKQKIILDYAIGGGIAVLYYVEPLLTYDLDIFFIPVEESIDVLSPIYEVLKSRGYKVKKEHILIEGIPVQFIPVYNDLIKDAVQQSAEAKYGRIKTRIVDLEYLIAIMLQTYRAKDRERIIKVHEETQIDHENLRAILQKHNLSEKYKEFRKKYFE